MYGAGTAPSGGVDVLLADGKIATLRLIRPSDHDALVALHESIGDDNVRLRFFSLNRTAARTYAEHLSAAPEHGGPITLVALLDDELVAVASAEPGNPGEAEVSFLVSDRLHGLGLGTLLLEHLAAAARDRGIGRFTAEVLRDNGPMLRVITDCGFDVERRSDHGVVTLELDTAATERAVAAADLRERQAEARSLAPLLYPGSVAVVGVRRDGGGVGRAVLEELRLGGFAGEVFVVHPNHVEIQGMSAVADFASIGRPVDLVVVAVPAASVAAVVQEAVDAGARSAIVLSSGFAEEGRRGAETQRELVVMARRHSMRLVGPNCLGVMSTAPEVRLNATFTHGLPEPGGLAVASQSGGVGIALLDLAQESGVGLACFVSLGNKADVSSNDLLAAWMDDPRVTAAALYLESFGNARKFARIAHRFAERKPLLAVVGGRSSGGQRAGASHTAAAAAPAVGVDALFAQAGVIGCTTLAELADAARLLTTQQLPAGPRLGILGNAGGLGVLGADVATAEGLVVPQLSYHLQERISTTPHATVGLDNPVDLGAAASAEGLLAAASTLLGSDEVDAVLLIIAGTRVTDADGFLASLAAAADNPPKPMLLVAVGGVTVPADSPAFARFRSVEDATRALAHATTYASWLAAPPSSPGPDFRGAAERARCVAAAALGSHGADHQGWLTLEQARELVAGYGIEGPRAEVEKGLPGVLAAANRIGYPVAIKVADPAVVHKTDRGLVRPGLATPEDVRGALEAITSELGQPDPPVLVQAQVVGGIEVAVGVVRDPTFGPLVMIAAGGVATDVWDDRVFLLPPFGVNDATRAFRRLRIWPLLAGFRGTDAVDITALDKLVQAVGQLALDVPELVEMDLNPVIVTPTGASCVDVKIRLAPSGTPDDAGIPRRLRTPT